MNFVTQDPSPGARIKREPVVYHNSVSIRRLSTRVSDTSYQSLSKADTYVWNITHYVYLTDVTAYTFVIFIFFLQLLYA